MKRVAVIGGGAWGSALASIAARAGAGVVLWARDPDVVAAINQRHENPLYLPGIALDPRVAATTGSSAIPGWYSGFAWCWLIAATTSGSRAHKTTPAPARAATEASALPQAPPPMTASRFTAAPHP